MTVYAEVLIDLVTDRVDRPFHYAVPPELAPRIEPGVLVRVPLGKRNHYGFVLRRVARPAVTPLREIMALVAEEPLFRPELIALSAWMAHRYFCRRIEALRAMLPAGFRQGRRTGVRLAAQDTLAVAVGTAQPGPEPERATRAFALTGPQQEAVERLHAVLKAGRPHKILLHGITGSGKTEVYLQAVAYSLQQGRGACVLVPEIALTPQMVERFRARFPGRLAVLHSRLTPAERAAQWRWIRDGRTPVVLGARSAVFAPLDRPGLFIVDEEHESSYKQEESPRYDAREVAWWRCRYHRGVLLLGSATPSLESYFQGEQKQLELLELPDRVTPFALPPVRVVDMRRELKEGHRHIFSRPLLAALREVLGRDEQAILFLNRRGYASFLLCRECGHVLRCPRCAVSLTLHASRKELVCHYCSYTVPVPDCCPECGGVSIRHFGVGTERVEKDVRRFFPGAPVVRMDSDTTAGRDSHARIFRLFRERRAKILVGTQMIAKGLDLQGVTLVGIITADTALNLPDFRSAERTFQLLTQVAGRAGRGAVAGRVILQTYHPAQDCIRAAAAHDFHSFYREELEHRRELSYPPFSEIIRFLFSGSDSVRVWEAASSFTVALEKLPLAGAEVLGPAPAPLFRLNENYRVQTILKGSRLAALVPVLRREMVAFRDRRPPHPVRLAVDFNPQAVL